MSDINVQTFSGKVNVTNNLLVGTSHLFVDTVNNKVGITTASPDAGLHVNSNAYVNTDFRVGTSIVMNDTDGQITAGSFVGNGSGLSNVNSDSGLWTGAGTGNVYLSTSTDNVGIGTSSPSAKLDVNGSILLPNSNFIATSLTDVFTYDGDSMPHYGLTWRSHTEHTGAKLFQLSAYNGVKFFTQGSERFFIDVSGNVGIGTSIPDSTLEVQGTASKAIKKAAPSAVTTTYNYVLNGPRPGTSSGGAVHFINGSSRSDDGGTNTYTIRNDNGQLRLGHSSFTTLLQGAHIKMEEGDNSFIHFGPNGTWSGELYVGATTDKSLTTMKAQCISTNGNLHLDAGDSKTTYINHYSGSNLIFKQYTVSGRPLAVVGKNNLGAAGQSSGVFVFNNALINSGIYNSSNGRFTIPIGYSGYYLVSFTGLGAYYNTNSPNTRWYVNGYVHSYGACHTNLSGYSGTPAHPGISGTHVLYLAENDYIDFRIIGGTLYGQSTLHAYATVMYLGG